MRRGGWRRRAENDGWEKWVCFKKIKIIILNCLGVFHFTNSLYCDLRHFLSCRSLQIPTLSFNSIVKGQSLIPELGGIL